jgi:hypothetical protein
VWWDEPPPKSDLGGGVGPVLVEAWMLLRRVPPIAALCGLTRYGSPGHWVQVCQLPQETRDQSVVGDVVGNIRRGPGGHWSPRHRVPLNSRNEGS